MCATKKTIVKSVSLEPLPELAAFVAKQKNFSRSIRVLIQQSIYQNNGKIVDVGEVYERAVQAQIFGSGGVQEDAPIHTPATSQKREIQSEKSPQAERNAGKAKKKSGVEIPEGY